MKTSISSIILSKLSNGSQETACRCFSWRIKRHQNSMKSMSSESKIDTSHTLDIIKQCIESDIFKRATCTNQENLILISFLSDECLNEWYFKTHSFLKKEIQWFSRQFFVSKVLNWLGLKMSVLIFLKVNFFTSSFLDLFSGNSQRVQLVVKMFPFQSKDYLSTTRTKENADFPFSSIAASQTEETSGSPLPQLYRTRTDKGRHLQSCSWWFATVSTTSHKRRGTKS